MIRRREMFGSAVLNNPECLLDGNTLRWHDFDKCIKDEANKVSQLDDLSGQNLHLSPGDVANKPLHTSTGILFDGTNYMANLTGTIPRPITVYFVAKILSWTDNFYFYDSVKFQYGYGMSLCCSGEIPNIAAYSYNSSIILPCNLSKFQIFRTNFNGINSSFKIDSVNQGGNIGDGSSTGLILGNNGRAVAYGYSLCGNMLFKEMIVRNTDTPENQLIIENYLKNKYLL